MSFSFSPFGGITISGPDGAEPFGTDTPKFHVMDEITGSFYFPLRQSDYYQNFLLEADWDVCSCDPAATTAAGGIKLVWDGSSDYSTVSSGDWYMSNGSFVVHCEFSSQNVSGYTNSATRTTPSMWTQVTPLCLAGRLVLREKTYIRGFVPPGVGLTFASFSRLPFTLTFDLLTGTFT